MKRYLLDHPEGTGALIVLVLFIIGGLVIWFA